MKPLLLALLFLCAPCLRPAWSQPQGDQTFTPYGPLENQFHLKTERFGMPAVSVGTDIYIIGGYTRTGRSDTIERIDTATNVVSTLPLKILKRGFHTAAAIGDSIYIIGGDTDFVECFNTKTQKVTTVADIPAILRTPSSVAVDGKIYVIGGTDIDVDVDTVAEATRQKTLWIYNPQTDNWTQGAPMHVAREGDVVAANGTIYAFGGFDGKTALTVSEAYDIATDTWHDLPPLPVKTSANHFAQIGDSIWSFGDYTDMSRVQRFDLKTQTWQLLNGTAFDARRHMAVCTVGNKIYVIGGNVASFASYLDEVQIFDAAKLK